MDHASLLSSLFGCRCHAPGPGYQPASPGRRLFTGLAVAAAASAATPALANIPECRRSRAASLAPASYVENMAQQQYAQMMNQARQQRALATGGVQLERLRYIAARIVPFTPACNERARQWKWEVNLLGSEQINAFCMPGGKIAFYTGILARLKLDDDEVAMIMGHEVAHALLEHARERMVKAGGTELLLRGGAALLGLGSLGDAAAAGASQLLGLKFSRDDESQADNLGLIMAAQAGYDPKAGVSLWQKMSRVGGDKPPPWLSTHPAGEQRIAAIEARLPQVTPMFQRAPKPPRRFGPPAG